jgi:lipopolysaccharide export system protein LptC
MKAPVPAELHLPDLPELPLSLGPAQMPPGGERRSPSLSTRLRNWVGSYLPLLLMTALALGTWWMVRNAPEGAGALSQNVPRHEPDYTLDRFTMQRFDPTGALHVVIEGDHMRHYPDDDMMEVEAIRVVSTEPDGRKLTATAKQGRAKGDGTEVWLDGQAQVLGEQPGELPIQINGEHLRAQPKLRRVESDSPVTVTQGNNRFDADGMIYDHDTRLLTLLGKSHGVYLPTPRATTSAGAR